MAVRIEWKPPVVLEERKRVKWERIIRSELTQTHDPIDVSLCFESNDIGWRVETQPAELSRAKVAALWRTRLIAVLRAAGKPVI
jgi:hypothetical protein